jgi:hypothetical protein
MENDFFCSKDIMSDQIVGRVSLCIENVLLLYLHKFGSHSIITTQFEQVYCRKVELCPLSRCGAKLALIGSNRGVTGRHAAKAW